MLKAKPGSSTTARRGNGTILHLAAAMFLDEAGTKARHIPYKGVGPMVTDLIGGQVEFATAALPSRAAAPRSRRAARDRGWTAQRASPRRRRSRRSSSRACRTTWSKAGSR